MDSSLITGTLLGIAGTLLGAVIVEGSQWLRSSRERKDKFKLAALEKRLEVHQEAYAHWRELIYSLNEEPKRLIDLTLKGQEWWDKHCLYLDAKSREYFLKSIHLALAKDRKKVREFIEATGEYLVRGVSLPFLVGEESDKQIQDKSR